MTANDIWDSANFVANAQPMVSHTANLPQDRPRLSLQKTGSLIIDGKDVADRSVLRKKLHRILIDEPCSLPWKSDFCPGWTSCERIEQLIRLALEDLRILSRMAENQ